MLESTMAIGQALISGWWDMLAITVPGFTFTFREMYLGVAICSLSLLLIKFLFGVGGGRGGESSRSGSSRNPKISKERQGDEF